MNALVCRTASRTLKHDPIKWRSIGCPAANRDNDGSERRSSLSQYGNEPLSFQRQEPMWRRGKAYRAADLRARRNAWGFRAVAGSKPTGLKGAWQ